MSIAATSSLPLLSDRLVTHIFRFNLLSKMNQRLPGFVISSFFPINWRVLGLLSRLLKKSTIFLLAHQWLYPWANSFKILEFVILTCYLSMKLRFLQIVLIAWVRSRMKFFDLTYVMHFFSEAFSLVSSRFVIKAMFLDWSVDRIFRSVFINWPCLLFYLRSSVALLMTYAFS